MFKKIFVLHSPENERQLTTFLAMQPKQPVLEVEVRHHKVDRSALQNSLYWLWVTVLANEQGLTKDEVHLDLKKRLLIRLYERDDPQGFGSMMETLRNLYREGHREAASALHDSIAKVVSTKNAKVDLFREYLDDIEKDSISRGIELPQPQDRYSSAMGKK